MDDQGWVPLNLIAGFKKVRFSELGACFICVILILPVLRSFFHDDGLRFFSIIISS